MMNTHDYMQALKSAIGIESDYALAKAMHVGQTTASSWRLGKTTISDSYAPRIAAILNLPVEKVLADLHAERERDPALRRYWLSISERFTQLACIFCMLASFYITLAPRTAEASCVNSSAMRQEYKFPNCCFFARFRRWLSRSLAFLWLSRISIA